MEAQEKIYEVIQPQNRLPETPYQNAETKHRRIKQPDFKLEKEVDKTRMKQHAGVQAQILKRIGILPSELQGDIPDASQLIQNGNGIPKSRAKFFKREQQMKKKFDEQIA